MTSHLNVEPFKIQNEQEAEDYLRALLSRDEARNMSSVMERIGLVEGENLRRYFVEKAKELLST